MRIIISPAKKMKTDTDSFAVTNIPVFIRKAENLVDMLNAISLDEL